MAYLHCFTECGGKARAIDRRGTASLGGTLGRHEVEGAELAVVTSGKTFVMSSRRQQDSPLVHNQTQGVMTVPAGGDEAQLASFLAAKASVVLRVRAGALANGLDGDYREVANVTVGEADMAEEVGPAQADRHEAAGRDWGCAWRR